MGLGSWGVIAQYRYGEVYRTDFLCHGRVTKDHALDELRAVLHTCVPSRNIAEQWRHGYRFADRETFLLVVEGRMTKWEYTLRTVELISDSRDPAVAERAQAEQGPG